MTVVESGKDERHGTGDGNQHLHQFNGTQQRNAGMTTQHGQHVEAHGGDEGGATDNHQGPIEGGVRSIHRMATIAERMSRFRAGKPAATVICCR